MTELFELFSEELFCDMLAERYIRRQHHPDYPLAILNYTEKAQFDRVWNEVTLQCRGLIYGVDTDEVVARPFPKFFNLEELVRHGEFEDSWRGEPVQVTDKMDGSLGIVYPTPAGWAVATRGSFTSEQALWATDYLQGLLADGVDLEDNKTDLVEIVYPENRIVLDYAGRQGLFWLGYVDIETGCSYQQPSLRPWAWPVELVTKSFEYTTLDQALAAEPRPNAEGLVVHFQRSNVRVKIKQEDYVRLHRIITGLNARSVWEVVSDRDADLIELYSSVPDEFHHWISTVAEALQVEYQKRYDAIDAAYWQLMAATGSRGDRKEWARLIKETYPNLAKYLFLRLDGKPVHDVIWKEIKPRADWTPVTPRGEDVA